MKGVPDMNTLKVWDHEIKASCSAATLDVLHLSAASPDSPPMSGYVMGFAKLCVDTDQLSHNNCWQQATSTKTLFEPSFSTVWVTCHQAPLLPTKLDKSKLRFLLCFHRLEHELHPKINV